MTARGKPSGSLQWQLLVYSVEKLRGRNLLKNAKPLVSLKFERSEGLAIFDDISSESIVLRQVARLCLVFRNELIRARNPQCWENEFFNRIDRLDSFDDNPPASPVQ